MVGTIDYSPTIYGLSTDLLSGWLVAQSPATLSANAQLNSSLLAAQNATEIIPPWDVSLPQPTPDERLNDALSGKPFVDESAVKLQDPDASETDQKLFALYNALAKLSAIANNAATTTTPEAMFGSLNNHFQSGLSEILSYAASIDLTTLAVIGGTKASYLDATSIVVPSALSQYTTGIIHNADPSTAMAGISGTEKFTVAVTKGGATTNVSIDLSELGTSSVSLNDFVDFVNDKLQAAGMVSRFKVVRLDTKNADGTEKSPLPQSWGINIQGTSTEILSFSAQDTGAAVYLAANSGAPDETAGQMIKLNVSSGTPVLQTSDRVEAASIEVAPTANSVSSDNTNADVQATIASFNQILAEATGSTTETTTVTPPTTASASAIDADGNFYMLGTTEGSLNGEVLQGDKDVYLTKYDSTGHVVWQQMIGDAGTTEGYAVAVDSSGNVVIAGSTTGSLTGGSNSGQTNSFVTKFDRYGQELFTRDVGPLNADSASSLVIGSDGSIYFGGQVSGSIASGITSGGGTDGFITKLSSTGSLIYNRQFGGSGNEKLTGLAIDAAGNLVALSMEDGHAIVRKYDSSSGTSGALWQTDLGYLAGGDAGALTIDGANIYVGGSTNSSSIGTSSAGYHGGTEGFVIALNSSGTMTATTYVGTSSTDRIRSITVKSGEIYVAGDTSGSLDGTAFTGTVNGFAAKLDGAGGLSWVYQYDGRAGYGRINSLQVDTSGVSVLDKLGLPKGRIDYDQARTVTARTTVRPGQYFYISVNGGLKRRIEIEADDTLNSLTLKINAVLLLYGTASVHRITGGTNLRIQGREGSRIDLIAGDGANDALKGLGLAEGTIIQDSLFSDDESTQPTGSATTEIGKIFGNASDSDAATYYLGLGLSSSLSITSHDGAAYINGLIQNAMSDVRDAFRTLNPDPTLAALSGAPDMSGPVPAYLTAQLANYQSGLQRLLAGGTLV